MEVSNILIEAIKQFEGLRLSAFQDSKGVWTIGYGHTSGVIRGQRITEERAEAYLRTDIAASAKYINSLNIAKTQGQFDALVDFVYNAGRGNFQSSTLLKYIRQNRPLYDIQAQFLRWVYITKIVNGKAIKTKLPGLVNRRKWEAKRYEQ